MGMGADSEEKHEPVSDIDTAMVVDSLKALDPKRPIREADILSGRRYANRGYRTVELPQLPVRKRRAQECVIVITQSA
jgi:hypothetical protein